MDDDRSPKTWQEVADKVLSDIGKEYLDVWLRTAEAIGKVRKIEFLLYWHSIASTLADIEFKADDDKPIDAKPPDAEPRP